MRFRGFAVWGIAVLLCVSGSALAQRQMENLGRGVVAVNQGEGRVFVSWRLLGTEPQNIPFNIYRQSGNGQPIRLNAQPITNATCYHDTGVNLAQDITYTVRPVINGVEGEPNKPFLNKIAANSEAIQ